MPRGVWTIFRFITSRDNVLSPHVSMEQAFSLENKLDSKNVKMNAAFCGEEFALHRRGDRYVLPTFQLQMKTCRKMCRIGFSQADGIDNSVRFSIQLQSGSRIDLVPFQGTKLTSLKKWDEVSQCFFSSV